MNYGLVARPELSRGLGLICHSLARHVPPTRTLVIDMTGHNAGNWQQSIDDFPDPTVVKYDDLNEGLLRAWLRGLDVVYCVETGYHAAFFDIAREMGVRSILHVMPELDSFVREPNLPKPDLFANPTSYRDDFMSQPSIHLPVPVDRDLLKFRHRTSATTFLHPAGHRAMIDRNGTRIFLQALPHVTKFCRVVIRSQDALEWRVPSTRFVQVGVVTDDYPDYAMPYDEGDVLVLPRRYAGLSMPQQEAMSCGLPILATDCSPNTDWLHEAGRIPVHHMTSADMKGGRIPVNHADPRALAAMMDRMVEDSQLVARMSLRSDEYAESISWTTMASRYRELLAGGF